MFLVVVGVNYRTTPVEIREKLTFNEHSLVEALGILKSNDVVDGCAILSTCNRTEIYAATRDLDAGFYAIWNFLSRWSDLTISDIKSFTYCHTLYDTIRHLFRVSAGLDSMLLGETQILGQVCAAYSQACDNITTNRVINTLFQQAILVGKKVRTETKIDQNAVSISYAAVELVKNNVENLSSCSSLVIGAGQMGQLALKHLMSNGLNNVIVSNRSFQRAVELASTFGGNAVPLDKLYHYIKEVDIVISCTAAPHHIIGKQEMAVVMKQRHGRRIFIVDIAVPRDVEPGVGDLEGVTLCDINDLASIVDNNMSRRKKAAIEAEAIIENELDKFMKWLSTQFAVPTITALKKWGEEIKQKELKQALNRLRELSPHDKKVVCSLANSITNQILHVPIIQLKSYAHTSEGHLYTEILQNLFDLDIPEQCPQSAKPRIEKQGKPRPVKNLNGGCK